MPLFLIMRTTGFIETAGDNTVIDLSTVPSYEAGKSFIRVNHIRLQASTADANILTLKNGAVAEQTVICSGIGSGIDTNDNWCLSQDSDLVINLSAATRIYWTLDYEVN